MTCRQVVEFLLEYLSGEMATEEHLAVEAHLQVCPQCSTYLRSYVETVKLGKVVLRHTDEDVPDDVPDDLVHAILIAQQRRS